MVPRSSRPSPQPAEAWLDRKRAATRRLLHTCILVARIRLGLTFSSLAGVRRRLLPPGPFEAPLDLGAVRIAARDVGRAARLVPFASCLTQAVAGQVLLARRGIASDIQLGVRRGRKGRLKAHAWLICEGRIVLGGDPRAIRQFSPIARLGPA